MAFDARVFKRVALRDAARPVNTLNVVIVAVNLVLPDPGVRLAIRRRERHRILFRVVLVYTVFSWTVLRVSDSLGILACLIDSVEPVAIVRSDSVQEIENHRRTPAPVALVWVGAYSVWWRLSRA
jgi:hypothetical protein